MKRIIGERDGHKIIIDLDGNVSTVSVEGVKGSACTDLTRQIEEGLGKVQSDEPTPEMYEQATEGVQIG